MWWIHSAAIDNIYSVPGGNAIPSRRHVTNSDNKTVTPGRNDKELRRTSFGKCQRITSTCRNCRHASTWMRTTSNWKWWNTTYRLFKRMWAIPKEIGACSICEMSIMNGYIPCWVPTNRGGPMIIEILIILGHTLSTTFRQTSLLDLCEKRQHPFSISKWGRSTSSCLQLTINKEVEFRTRIILLLSSNERQLVPIPWDV